MDLNQRRKRKETRSRRALRLHRQGRSSQQIANELGVRRSTVASYLRSAGIFGRQHGFFKEPTRRQEAILLGTLLGDGCLAQQRPTKNAHLVLKHCAAQEGYLRWKVTELGSLFRPKAVRRGHTVLGKKRHAFVQAWSRAHPVLTKLRALFYGSGGKQITKDVLRRMTQLGAKLPLALAVWYMDDGHLMIGRYVRIALGPTEDTAISTWFEQMGFHGTESKHARANCTYYSMHADASRRFFKTIRPHLRSEMAYKVPH